MGHFLTASTFDGETDTLFALTNFPRNATSSLKRTKLALISAPCLAYPTPDGHFILDTDASDLSIGAVRSQIQKEETKVIC
jgi:hypothetical protein